MNEYKPAGILFKGNSREVLDLHDYITSLQTRFDIYSDISFRKEIVNLVKKHNLIGKIEQCEYFLNSNAGVNNTELLIEAYKKELEKL